MTTSFYAVKEGRTQGVFLSWPECQSQVNGYRGAVYKKFPTRQQAETFINSAPPKSKLDVPTRQQAETFINVAPPKSKLDLELQIDSVSDLVVTIFTDGSCCLVDVIGDNGLSKREQRAGFGYYIPSINRQVARPLAPPYTNNRAELTAVLEAVHEWPETSRLHIVTDSRYVVLIFTGTGLKYASKGYLDEHGQPVKNADLVKQAVELLGKYQLEFTRVDAHTGKTDFLSRGNAIADRLAVDGAKIVI